MNTQICKLSEFVDHVQYAWACFFVWLYKIIYDYTFYVIISKLRVSKHKIDYIAQISGR